MISLIIIVILILISLFTYVESQQLSSKFDDVGGSTQLRHLIKSNKIINDKIYNNDKYDVVYVSGNNLSIYLYLLTTY
jgi:hypothetical protein